MTLEFGLGIIKSMNEKTSFIIRLVSDQDADQILEIYRPIVSETAISFEESPPSIADMQTRIKRISSTYPWLVALNTDSKIVGYAYAGQHRERTAYRWAVDVSAYVREGYRGQGLGRLLYAKLFELLKQQNFIRAFAGITLPNEPSIKLHEGMGFNSLVTYRDIGFKLGRWHDVGWWEIGLTPLKVPPSEPLSISEFNKLF